MCRLFGMVARERGLATPWLLDAPIPFVRLAQMDPEQQQRDGWGIAWYNEQDRACAEKGAEGVHLAWERERFTDVARGTRAQVLIAHLRKASNPLDLPHERLISLENTQPFLDDGTLFAHNGWIPHPRETISHLGPRAGRVRGVNDSEVLQQLFLKELDLTKDPLRAYPAMVRRLLAVWEERGRQEKGPYGGLNLLFASSPRELWAFCHYLGEHGCALSGLPRPYYEMSYREGSDHVLVASEPTDRDLGRWHPLRNGEYLHITLTHEGPMVRHGGLRGLPMSGPPRGPAAPPPPVALPAA